MNITLDDGRTELWQWDTGRKIIVDDKSVSEVHYSKYSSTQAITREVIDGKAEIPNFLLQDTHAVTVYAYAGSVENGYTMAEKTFNVVKKPKPANYVETEEDKAILAKLKAEIGDLTALQTKAKDNLVAAINEAAASGGSVPKPLTYDYMPAGYPSKSVQTVTLMEEQELAFASEEGVYLAQLAGGFLVAAGQTYAVKWDGAEYECVGAALDEGVYMLGNLSIAGPDADTGEPFLYICQTVGAEAFGQFGTFDTSANHTISVKRMVETVTPIDEKYLPESAFTNAEWSKISNKIVDYKQQRLSLSVSGEQITIIAGTSISKNIINDKLKFEDGMVYKINGSITIHSPSTAGGNNHTLYVNGNYTCSRGLVEFGSLYDNYYRKDIVLGLYSSSSDDTYYYGYLYVSSGLPGSTTWTFDINITVTEEAKLLPDICIGKNIQRVGDNVIISSSTPDSTKQFKITVDDTGTLKATEVIT